MEFVLINSKNERFVKEIHPGDEEKYWVHYNSYWQENGEKKDDVEARLIYVDEFEVPVGFIAYGQHYADEELEEPVESWGEVIHLVVDKAKQGNGYGRQATLLALERLRTDPRYGTIVIAHHPDNLKARKLYESLGFVEVGRNYDGDPLLQLAES